jgi:hypothetical protein
VTLAGTAASLCTDDVRTYWQDRARSVSESSVADIVGAAPALPDKTREFLVGLVLENRRRLLDELS